MCRKAFRVAGRDARDPRSEQLACRIVPWLLLFFLAEFECASSLRCNAPSIEGFRPVCKTVRCACAWERRPGFVMSPISLSTAFAYSGFRLVPEERQSPLGYSKRLQEALGTLMQKTRDHNALATTLHLQKAIIFLQF